MIFNKQINLILMMSLLLFLCLGTVCASDSTIHSMNDDNMDIGSMDNVVEMPVSDSVADLDTGSMNDTVDMSVSDSVADLDTVEKDENMVSPLSNLSFTSDLKELEEKINNTKDNIIYLDKDYKYNGESDLSTGISINSNIVIDGQGHSIDGAGIAHIFNIADNVTLKNINFINTKSDLDGSAIYCHGSNCSVVNCVFVKCSANNGGAVFWKGHNGLVNGCNFTFCSANKGGAIYCAKC
mgnify:CR=1 FL=1